MSGDSLIPDENWVTHPDPDYDAACPVCSALVESRAVHRAWHEAIARAARSYVSPPMYGSRRS